MDCNDERKEPNHSARLTREMALWALVGLVALLLRLAQLGAAPLGAEEARAATAAWRAATGEGLPLTDYNPLLLAGNSLLFNLFGASDALARLWPALFGSLLALTPLLLRRYLGRVGALAAGVYLAISPTALVASRRLDGTMVAAAGVMVSVGAILRFVETRRGRWLTLGAAGLALAVSGGAAAYGLLVPLGLAAGVLSLLWPDSATARLVRSLPALRSDAPRFFLVFVVALLLLSTGLGWNLSGLEGVGELLAEWFGRFRSEGALAVSPLVLLLVYESLGLGFGLGGCVWGVLRNRPGAMVLGLWTTMGLLLLALMPGRAPTDLVWVVLPLALLTGMGVEGVARGRWCSGGALRLVYGGVVLIVWAHCYLMLARYATYGERADLALALVAVVVQGLLGVSSGMLLGGRESFRAAAAGTGVALLMLMLSAGWGVAYGRPADPREALLKEPTAVNVRDLVQTLRDISWQETGVSTSLAFTFEAPPDSVLPWYLRDFDRARRVDRLGDMAADEVGAIAVTHNRDEVLMVEVGASYAGQDFSLRRHWTPRDLGCRVWEPGCHTAVDWFLFRDGVPLPEADRWATLWRAVDARGGE